MKELMEQMGQKPEQMQDSDVQAKLEVLKELHEMATKLLAGDLEESEEMPMDMEKVEVMAEDQEGLEEGLDMAQKVLKKKEDLTGDFY